MKIPSQLYLAPEVEEITLSFSSAILSGSPQPGENEGVDYEDWGI